MTGKDEAAAERKRKRLEAWRKRQEQKAASARQAEESKPTKPKIKLSFGAKLGSIGKSKKKRGTSTRTSSASVRNVLNDGPEEEEGGTLNGPKVASTLSGFKADELISTKKRTLEENKTETTPSSSSSRRKRNRWDVSNEESTKGKSNTQMEDGEDGLDKFMNELQAGAMGNVPLFQQGDGVDLSINVSGSMIQSNLRNQEMKNGSSSSSMVPTPTSGGVITPEELEKLSQKSKPKRHESRKEDGALYGPSDWESEKEGASASEAETDDEEEEKSRREFLQALQRTTIPMEVQQEEEPAVAQLASQVKTEKQRREDRLKQLKLQAAEAVKESAKASQPDIGRFYNDDVEGGVMEEAERTLNVVNMASQDALEVLAELNKKKELKAVNHDLIEYLPIRKNMYIVPRSLARLSGEDVLSRRAKMKIRCRGKGAPAPVSTFEECGLSERVLGILGKQKIVEPFPVQAQCIPCIMAGRDVIGIAKTGSGKTLAYLLPMLRHIVEQSDLEPNESGPIGLILAPARELAHQIHLVAKGFAKQLGLNNPNKCSSASAVYGGAGVAEQIGDLKRGTHIVVATPGRMIDILTMQAGKILSLQRVSFVTLDEADRMFDMGFAPQISAILSAVRPDRQTVLFSATFPKAVETLARKSLKYPIEVLVGGRSVASDSVTQYGELVEEEDKFLRLLQLLGEHMDDDNKVIVFVDSQVRADSVFEQLVRNGYSSLSLHGGKEQEDRDSTISDFKRNDGPGVLVATSVAARGLDVRACGCVINYSSPNHLEDYVHRVGRTGRAGNTGIAYTFVNSGDEAEFAPIVVRAIIEAGQAENIEDKLRALSDEFKKKVERGEAKFAGNGFKGKGYSYDSTELSDAQKLAKLEKRQALIEAGMIDPEEEEFNKTSDVNDGDNVLVAQNDGVEKTGTLATGFQAPTLSADLLALPGMKEAVMRQQGFELPTDELSGGNHFVEEVEINDYPREARWKVTQKETTSRLSDDFKSAVTLKGKHYESGTEPKEGERKLYLHVEATSSIILKTCVQEIRRLLNEETLRVGARGMGGHRYNVLG